MVYQPLEVISQIFTTDATKYHIERPKNSPFKAPRDWLSTEKVFFVCCFFLALSSTSVLNKADDALKKAIISEQKVQFMKVVFTLTVVSDEHFRVFLFACCLSVHTWYGIVDDEWSNMEKCRIFSSCFSFNCCTDSMTFHYRFSVVNMFQTGFSNRRTHMHVDNLCNIKSKSSTVKTLNKC